VEKTDAGDYGARAPWRAEKLPLIVLIPRNGGEFAEVTGGIDSADEVGVRTPTSPWPAWHTKAPAGAWVISVEKDAADYGAGAPSRAKKLPLKILIPAKGA
jgi:hypothetical protein